MLFKDMPIQKKLVRIIFLISGAVLLVTCITFFVYEFYAFRIATIEKLSTIGKIIAANSTATLAFDDREGAKEILAALRTEPHIVAAALYDEKGNLFSQYPENLAVNNFPASPGMIGFNFSQAYLEGFQPLIEGTRRFGTLYLKSDLEDIYERFRLYGIITILAIALSLLLAYLLSKILQKSISNPILALAKTAKTISVNRDYSFRAIKSGEDELGSLTDSFNDMLHQIQLAEEENRKLNEDLELRVKQRTEEVEAFSYSISHDLRAPLRAVSGYAKIIEEDYNNLFDDEGKRLLIVVQKNAEKMGILIDDLLAFSKLGRKEIYKTNVNMKLLTENAVEELNRSLRSKAEIKIDHLHSIMADSSLINQVMANLISNAIKYSSETEKPFIEIKSEKKDGELIYSVSDNGAGFNMEYVNKLFGVFQRLHSAEEFEGSGVGLAIVKRIINKHNGRVWAEGELGKGATFYFSLPDYEINNN